MKRIVCFILTLCLLLSSVCVLAEDYDAQLLLECDSEKIEVGDQFLVVFKLSEVKPYLTYQLNGAFDAELAEIVAPVYTNEQLGVLENTFSNERGLFKFVAYDSTIRGIKDDELCSILFKAKKAGEFKITMNSDELETMVGKAGENTFYNLKLEDGAFVIGEDTDDETVSIIEDAKPVTPFDDMYEYDWAERAVGVMHKLGVLKGIADESYFPGENVNRGDFITMLIRVCKLKKNLETEGFGDVTEDMYNYDEIMTAKAMGIAKGDENGNFRPDDFITREDICTLVYRTMKKMNKVKPTIVIDDYLGDFADRETIASYAVESVAGVIRAKLVMGDENGLLRPKDNMTRAEAAVVLNRLAEYNILISM